MGVTCLYFSLTLAGSGPASAVVFAVLMGISFSLFLSPNNLLVMQLAPADSQGVASGVFKMVTGLGLAFGICIFETVYSFSLPVGFVKGSGNGEAAAAILHGLQHSFQLGVIVCAGALFFAFCGSSRRHER